MVDSLADMLCLKRLGLECNMDINNIREQAKSVNSTCYIKGLSSHIAFVFRGKPQCLIPGLDGNQLL